MGLEKKYTLDLAENKKYLIVKALGDFTIDVTMQWSIELPEKSRELSIYKSLFDVRLAKLDLSASLG